MERLAECLAEMDIECHILLEIESHLRARKSNRTIPMSDGFRCLSALAKKAELTHDFRCPSCYWVLLTSPMGTSGLNSKFRGNA